MPLISLAAPQLGTAVANGHVTEDSAVVGVVVTAVGSLVVVGRNALHLGDTAKIGGGVAEDDESTPLSAGVVGHGAIERVGLVGHDDGAIGRAVGDDLAAAGHDEGRSVRTGTSSAFDHRAGVDGEHLAVLHEDVTVDHVGVVTGPVRRARATSRNRHDRAIGHRRAVTLGLGHIDRSKEQAKKERVAICRMVTGCCAARRNCGNSFLM